MFDANKVSIETAIEARKEKIDRQGAWDILGSAKKIVVGRGKKYLSFDPETDDKEEILKLSLGRSGTLRAPTLVIGDLVIVGFNDEMYQEYVK